MASIYRIENTITGQLYIGQTVDYKKRKAQHIAALNDNRHCNAYLQRAWNKYGENAFEFAVVVECEEDRLDELEVSYIRDFNTVAPKGYNMTLGGDGARGLKWSREAREARSAAMIGKRVGSEATFYAKTHSPETLEKLRLSTTALWKNDEYRQRQVIAHTGVKQSEETKRKRGVALVGNTNNKKAHRYLCVETGKEYDSVGQIDLGFEICKTAIYRASKTGIRAYGYHWQFADAK